MHETSFPGQPQEMVSIYTAEGPDLIMVHYCILGNQPRLKADPKSPPNQIVFQFVSGGNLDPKKDKHMHDATPRQIDKQEQNSLIRIQSTKGLIMLQTPCLTSPMQG